MSVPQDVVDISRVNDRPSGYDLGAMGRTGVRSGSACWLQGSRKRTAQPDPTGRGVEMNPSPYNILIALQEVRGLISVSQVAELFGKSPATIYRMTQKRQIPSIMLEAIS